MQPQEKSSFAPQEGTPAPQPVADYMAELVGPGKKYETVEELAKGSYHAQAHIKTLLDEAAARKEELERARTLEEVLAAVDQRAKTPKVPPHQNIDGSLAGQGTPQETPVAGEPLDRKTIEETFKSLLKETTEAQRREQNFNHAVSALDSRYGSREAANQAVSAKAAELGVTVEWLKDAAEQTPQAFLKLMNDGESRKPEAPVRTPSRTNATMVFNTNAQSEPKPGTYRYYQTLRKKDPAAYRKSYNRQMKEMSDDPNKFYERD